jgi:3-hydroxyacyl-[acyl-carrier-protein] dehydratase
MLVNDFCKILSLQTADGTISAGIEWNAGHAIFAGHFPGNPVVPGVCMLQLVQEIMEDALQKKLLLRESGQMKFLQFIDPRNHPQVQLQINYTAKVSGELQTAASIQFQETVFFRFVGVFALS